MIITYIEIEVPKRGQLREMLKQLDKFDLLNPLGF